MDVWMEKFLERIIYLFNTIDTYFLISGIFCYVAFSFLLAMPINFTSIIVYSLFLYAMFKLGDFYLYYSFMIPVFIYLFYLIPNFDIILFSGLLLTSIVFFYLSQFFLYSVPYMIILKDITLPFRIIVNSMITFAPTSSSAIMSIFFSSMLTMLLFFQPNPLNYNSAGLLGFILAASLLNRLFLPKTFQSGDFKPEERRNVKRVIYLNIDGCRHDRFNQANLPFMRYLEQNSAYFKNGAITVYRALTNPAFAAILTGATPKENGVMDNNFHSGLKLEALPDLVDTILYGNIHIKDITKPNWTSKVVSLPKYGVKSDDVLINMLKEDLLNNKARLFIADLSDVDIAGHAYGSESKHYIKALQRIDNRIEKFFNWLKINKLDKDTIVIIGSDHGQAGMEHSYMFAKSEKYVPLIFYGEGIKHKVIDYIPSIMDLNLTMSYILGLKYCKSAKGRVLSDIFD